MYCIIKVTYLMIYEDAMKLPLKSHELHKLLKTL